MHITQPQFVRTHGLFPGAAIVAVLVAMIAGPRNASASAFALSEQNAIGLGAGYSSTAVAADASTNYFNPAGLMLLKKPQAIVIGSVISVDAHFTDKGSTTAGLFPIGGGNGGNAGVSKFIPAVYYAQPINDSIAFGIGLSTPWGLETNFANGWVGRYQALTTFLKSANLNPSIAWRFSDQLTFGVGVDIQRVDAEMSNAIDFGLIGYGMGIPGFLPGNADATVDIKGHSIDYGWNAGFLLQLDPKTRIGMSYRAGITHTIKGTATFTGVPAPFAAGFPNQDASARLPVPYVLSIHGMQQINDQWMLTADYSLFGFSSLKSLDIIFANPATPASSLVQNWRNAAIMSLGVHYRLNDAVTLRAGAVYNESPVTDPKLRSPRIPDSNRRWLAAGVSWKADDHFNLDAGYARVEFSDAPLNTTDAFGHNLLGVAKLSANVLSVQGTWSF